MVQNLPTSETYEKEFHYMPWGKLINEIKTLVSSQVAQNGKVLDLLCGPGYLLGQLQKMRPDLSYYGVDLESEFITHAKELYPDITFEVADAFEWKTETLYDVVLCTGGLHHLPYNQQESFVEKLSKLIKSDGFAIMADPYIDDFSNEAERKIAGAKLGYEYLAITIRNGATDDVIKAAIEILSNDVQLVEFKSSVKKNKAIFEKYFSKIEMHKTWPDSETEYGDYYFILKK
jgi:2-polyprenyl-3-methyl-5-hydroxy-6-metoxy-1,4-benzoquinol methylase